MDPQTGESEHHTMVKKRQNPQVGVQRILIDDMDIFRGHVYFWAGYTNFKEDLP
jgi:hypothetical protein